MPCRKRHKFFGLRRLLPDGTLVEGELLTLQDVTITATALAGTAGDDGVETTGLELPLDRGLDLSASLDALCLLLLNAVALLHLLSLRLLLPSATERLAVVGLVPLPEGRGIDLDHGGPGEGVGTDEFVVRRVEGHSDDTDFAGDAFATPSEVAGIDAEGTEFAVSATSADEMDALGSNTGVGGLTALLESSVLFIRH